MGEIEVFIELLDEPTINYILAEFFSENSNKSNIKLKKIKIQKLLREPNTNKIKSKYKRKGESCFNIVKRSMVDEELLKCDLNSFSSLITLEEKSNLSDLILYCTASIKFPDIIKDNTEIILANHRQNEFLFKNIKEFHISDTTLDSMILAKLRNDIEDLKNEIINIKRESDKIKEEHTKSTQMNNDLQNENKKLSKHNKNIDKELKTVKEENNYLLKENVKYKNDIVEKEEETNKFKEEIENINKEKEEILKKLEKFENDKYINLSNIENDKYNIGLIYTSDILALKVIFKEILFIGFEEYKLNKKEFVKRFTERGVKKIYIESNNVSPRELSIIKRAIKKEDIEYTTLISSSEMDLIKKLIDQNTYEEEYVFA